MITILGPRHPKASRSFLGAFRAWVVPRPSPLDLRVGVISVTTRGSSLSARCLFFLSAVRRVPRPCPPWRSEPSRARAAKGGAASAAPVDPGGQVTPRRRHETAIRFAVCVPGRGLAGGLLRSKPPSSLAAKRGSDDGSGPANRGGGDPSGVVVVGLPATRRRASLRR
jgi:hypothetical protein